MVIPKKSLISSLRWLRNGLYSESFGRDLGIGCDRFRYLLSDPVWRMEKVLKTLTWEVYYQEEYIGNVNAAPDDKERRAVILVSMNKKLKRDDVDLKDIIIEQVGL